MAAASSYEGQKTGNWVDGHVNFTLPAWAVWWIDWADLVVEWVKANTAKRLGNVDPLKQFIQKRGAQIWSAEDDRPNVNLLAANYSWVDYANGQKIDGEATRFITVDVQKDHFWVLCRAWTSVGTSKLILYQKVLGVDEIVDIQQRLGVRDNLVFMDSGYESGTVYDYCSRFSKYNDAGWLWNSGWTALKGSKQERFAHFPAQGKRVDRFFSPPAKVLGASGKHCRLISWSNLIAKDKLTHLRAAGPDVWAFPSDIGAAYMKQLVAEAKRDVIDKTTKAVTQRYVPIYSENHAWDCEAMQVVAASVTNILRGANSE